MSFTPPVVLSSPKKNLAILDIDGTLTVSIDSHLSALFATLQSFQFPRINTDFNSYLHHTDSWVFYSTFLETHGSIPSTDEVALFRKRFENAYAETVADLKIEEVPGALSFVRFLLEKTDWAICFATGSARPAARTKLIKTKIPFAEELLATSYDGLTRVEILETAIHSARRFYKMENFERIVSIGDGLWDLETAERMKIPFLGIATGAKAEKLREGGATVFADFSNRAEAIAFLEASSVIQF